MNTALPQTLMKVLVAPSRVAKNLNRGAGSVLSLNVHSDRICMSVGSYDNVKQLPPISIGSVKQTNGGAATSLQKIVEKYNVCGFVVAWPVQKDTGKWGAPCGRVLFALERLIGKNSKLFTRDRPLCFWDSFRTNHERKPVDEMGRCESFGEASEKSLHLASEEQYYHDEEVTSIDIWDDFCKVHLPQVSKRTARKRKEQNSQAGNLVSDWGDRRAFSNAFA